MQLNGNVTANADLEFDGPASIEIGGNFAVITPNTVTNHNDDTLRIIGDLTSTGTFINGVNSITVYQGSSAPTPVLNLTGFAPNTFIYEQSGSGAVATTN